MKVKQAPWDKLANRHARARAINSAGADAFRRGQDENTYPPVLAKWMREAWQAGWKTAEREARKARKAGPVVATLNEEEATLLARALGSAAAYWMELSQTITPEEYAYGTTWGALRDALQAQARDAAALQTRLVNADKITLTSGEEGA